MIVLSINGFSFSLFENIVWISLGPNTSETSIGTLDKSDLPPYVGPPSWKIFRVVTYGDDILIWSLCSNISGLLLIALRERTLLYSYHQFSIFRRALLRPMDRCAFRRSCQNLPLKLSINTLAVGFPSFEKSRITPF